MKVCFGLVGLACLATPACAARAPAPKPAVSTEGPSHQPAAEPIETEGLEPDETSSDIDPEAREPTVGPPRVHEPSAIEAQRIVVYEQPYRPGRRRVLSDATVAAEERSELDRWNQGGRQGRWHPAPRVIVDNVRVQGPVQQAVVLRDARKQGYWPIRQCYDAALIGDQTLKGRMSLRFTITAAGAVYKSRVAGKPTLGDAEAVACIRKGFGKLRFPAPARRANSTVTLDITVHPGDALVQPPMEPPEGIEGTLHAPTVQALVASEAGDEIQRCYDEGRQRVAGLWGRMALVASIGADGRVQGVAEVESTFPDSATTGCAAGALTTVVFPAPEGGALRLVIPLRLGQP